MSNKVLNHRNYLGSIEVSIEDNCLYGKILFINDLVTYEANTPDGLKLAFQEAVDGYLAFCKEEGIPADRPFSGNFNVRVPKEFHRKDC